MQMGDYIVFVGGKDIAKVSGSEAAYNCFKAARIIAEMTCQTASLVWAETSAVVVLYDPDFAEEMILDYFLGEECGFIPYEGSYPYDC
jgi:hypothetical protein